MNTDTQDFEKKLIEIGIVCFQQLLNFQTPWGEWGESGHDHAERLKRVGRERSLLQINKLPKPNMFRTLLGIETLTNITKNRFQSRIDLAFQWIEQQFKGGWFLAWMEGATAPSSDVPKVIRKIPDVRHTAQAAYVTIKYRGLTYEIVNAIENLLSNQLAVGGWSDDLTTKEAGLFTTVYTTELLYTLSQSHEQLLNFGRRDIAVRIKPAYRSCTGVVL